VCYFEAGTAPSTVVVEGGAKGALSPSNFAHGSAEHPQKL